MPASSETRTRSPSRGGPTTERPTNAPTKKARSPSLGVGPVSFTPIKAEWDRVSRTLRTFRPLPLGSGPPVSKRSLRRDEGARWVFHKANMLSEGVLAPVEKLLRRLPSWYAWGMSKRTNPGPPTAAPKTPREAETTAFDHFAASVVAGECADPSPPPTRTEIASAHCARRLRRALPSTVSALRSLVEKVCASDPDIRDAALKVLSEGRPVFRLFVRRRTEGGRMNFTAGPPEALLWPDHPALRCALENDLYDLAAVAPQDHAVDTRAVKRALPGMLRELDVRGGGKAPEDWHPNYW